MYIYIYESWTSFTQKTNWILKILRISELECTRLYFIRNWFFTWNLFFTFFYAKSVLHLGSVFQTDLLLCLNLDTTLDFLLFLIQTNTWTSFFTHSVFHPDLFFIQICSSLTLLSTQYLFLTQTMIFNWIWFFIWMIFFNQRLFFIQKLFFIRASLFTFLHTNSAIH